MNENDRRVIRTKRLLKESLKELMLLHEDYVDISVKELCDKADINRRTFYLHYESIDEVLLDIQEDFSAEFYERTKQYDHIKDAEPVIAEFFAMHEENPVYQKLILSPTQDYLREMMRSRTVSKLDENDNLKRMRHLDIITQNIIEQFYHMAVVSMYREWIRQRRIMPRASAIKLAADLVSRGLSAVIQGI